MTFHWLRTVFFLIPAISVYTIVLGALSIASSLVDRTGYFAHRCARAWSWLILATTGVEVEVDGLERLVPGRTYIFVSNHQSIYDIPILFASLPYQLRIIAKESLGRFPILGRHLRRTGHMLVDRRNPDRSSILRWMSTLVSQGLSLIVFPEGTRSDDGRVGRFKGGSFMLALETGLPIVPLSVVGSRRVMHKGELTVRPGRVRLVVHDPVAASETRRPSIPEVRELAERVRAVVRSAAERDVPAARIDTVYSPRRAPVTR